MCAAVGGRKPVVVENSITTTSAVRIGFDLGSEPVDLTAAHSGMDKHRDGARSFSPLALVGLRIDAGSRGLSPVVMMQPANQWQLDHLPNLWSLHRPRDWTVVSERPVGPNFMVIFEVRFETSPQLPFIENDDSIQALTPNRTD
jgi:hypothetical protein